MGWGRGGRIILTQPSDQISFKSNLLPNPLSVLQREREAKSLKFTFDPEVTLRTRSGKEEQVTSFLEHVSIKIDAWSHQSEKCWLK